MTYAQAFDINGNTPPQAVPLEESVLGALMLDQTALINAIETLHVEYFYKEEHQIIYRAIRKLFEMSQPVDLLTVVERLRLDGDLEAAGGAAVHQPREDGDAFFDYVVRRSFEEIRHETHPAGVVLLLRPVKPERTRAKNLFSHEKILSCAFHAPGI